MSVHPSVCHRLVRTSVHTYTNTLKTESSTIITAISLIVGIHVMVNWQLSKQAIHWPVSYDHIAGSGLLLIWFFWSWPLTRDWFFDWITGSRQVITLEEKGVRAKAKFRCKVTPGAFLTFLLTYSLHNHLISLLKFNWENSKTTRWTITCSQLIIFWVSNPRKTKYPLFSLWLVIAIRSSTFRLG